MRFAKLRSELLASRELRQQELERALASGRTVVSLALNIPGADKLPPGGMELYAWAKGRLDDRIPELMEFQQRFDLLGPFALYTTASDPRAAKLRCAAIEAEQPAARLLDLDVYAPSGTAVNRSELGLPRRACLLCSEGAVDCIRSGAHDQNLVVRRAHELLAACDG